MAAGITGRVRQAVAGMLAGNRRRALAGVLAVGALLGTMSGTALADEYCDIDPTEVVVTPDGNRVVVHVNNNGPTSHRAQLASASVTHTATRNAAGTTDVEITVLIADSDGHAHSVGTSAWTGANRSGTFYDGTSGYAGQAMYLRFTINVP